MEALIHHFKLVTEGFRVPPGEAYVAIESPRGELGCFVLADGSAKPARVHMRDPSFVNLQSLPDMATRLADRRLHRVRRDARPDPRRDRPVSAAARRGRPARRAARRPAGTRPCASTRTRRRSPIRPRSTCPPSCAPRSSGTWRKYPDRHSAALPALGAAQRVHGWCSPEAIAQVAAVMQVTPAYLSSVATFYDMLRTEPIGQPLPLRLHERRLPPAQRQGRLRRDRRARRASRASRTVEIREFECLGACDMAPMASIDGRYVGPLSEDDAPRAGGRAQGGPRAAARPRPVRPGLPPALGRGRRRARPPGPARGARRAPRRRHLGGRRGARRAARRGGRAAARRAAAAAPLDPGTQRAIDPSRDREERRASDRDAPAAGQHRRARTSHTIDVYERLGGYRAARKALHRDGPGGGAARARGVGAARPRRRRLLDGQEGVASSPRARWTSTSAATPTSPSRARSRTGC